MKKHLFFLLFFWALLTLLSCQQQTAQPTQDIPPAPTSSSEINNQTEATPQPLSEDEYVIHFNVGQTNIQKGGNRVVYGEGNIPNLTPIDIPLSGPPAWITAVSNDSGVFWVAVLEDGQAFAYFIADGQVEEIALTPDKLPEGMPPYVQLLSDTEPQLVIPPAPNSSLTHPVLFQWVQKMAYIDFDGNFVVGSSLENSTTLPVNAQPDARILVGDEQLLLFTDPTNEYAHAIMGDDLEAKSMTLVATTGDPQVIRTIPAQEGFVFEGIAPIWSDLNGDGVREIIATQANRHVGAQLVVFDEMGNLVAEGPAIGNGNRWRHQLAVAPFGPNQEIELVDIRTPHIGGPVEFFQWRGDQLVLVATVTGYTSHVIFSPNLDMGVAGPFDESGKMTLVVPSQLRDHLGGIQRTEDGAEVAWTLELNGRLLTNIYALPLDDGQLALGVGTDDNSLRIWQPNTTP